MAEIVFDDIVQSIKLTVETEIASGTSDIYFERAEKKNIPSKESILDVLEKEVNGCVRCPLEGTRRNTVFGTGKASARLMFVGEAPGADEDEQGLPFVGRAGQLLTKIIESIGLKREEVYIANILKCRPPGNRNPLPEEISSCGSYLEKQIDTIKPKVICALGKFSAQTLLGTETPISGLRGKFHDYKGIRLMPTYHPAYLLRNPSAKKEVWSDMKKIAKELNINVPKPKT